MDQIPSKVMFIIKRFIDELEKNNIFGDRHGYFMETYQKKCSAFYYPDSEGGILWSDPAIGIDWPLENFLLSDKDLKCPCLKDVPAERLPVMDISFI